MKSTFRKTKNGEWVIRGPKNVLDQALLTDTPVTVSLRDGRTKMVKVRRVGRGFTEAGVEWAYGYLAEQNTRPLLQGRKCDECGRPGAVHEAEDLSGIPGVVCDRCVDNPYKSFA
ncbi:hypothetical protein ACWFMI_23570 [Nocardiopsis terrae]|uniref:hypothetical protein n=1 Tax=Streptomyces sp. NPDC057554 TaxID=3350538 RepID=UPI0036817B57